MDRPFLNRSDSPLSAADWEQLDALVVDVARRALVGRRFLSVFGPLGAGVQDVDYDVFAGTGPAAVGQLGDSPTDAVRPLRRLHDTVPILYKDFEISWRDLETARQIGLPLDFSAAAAAASIVAQREDELIFNGLRQENCVYEGILDAAGRQQMPARDWSEAGSGFADVVDARARLLESGFHGPYAVIVNPKAYSQLHRVYANSGVLEINHMRDLATAGVFQTSALGPDSPGVVVSTGLQNLDLAIGQDLVTAYLGVENMNHPFRVFESLVLRIKRPGAICTLEPR